MKFALGTIVLLIGAISTLPIGSANNQAGDAQTNEIVRLDKAGKLEQAIQLLQEKPTYDANYFFNLGVLWGKANQIGLATAYLEKANRLKPHDPEIVQNLNHARNLLTTQLSNGGNAADPIDQASTSIEQISDRIHHDEILGILGLVVLIVSLLWIRAYLKTRNITKTFLKPSGWFGAFALMISFALYAVYRSGIQNPPAVVIIKQPLRSGPGMNYPEITHVQAGVKVRLMDSVVTVNENELWQKVRYKLDQSGWLPLSGLLPL